MIFFDQLEQLLPELLDVRFVQDLAIDKADDRNIADRRNLQSPVTGHKSTPVRQDAPPGKKGKKAAASLY